MVVDQKRGGLINFLMGLEFVDIYPLHAARAKDYRRALYPSGAKSDPVDAQIHGEFYLKHPERFTQCLKPDTVETRELNLLCEHRRGFVDQGTQFEQQLSSSLKQYNPLIIKLFDDLGRFLDVFSGTGTISFTEKTQPEYLFRTLLPQCVSIMARLP